MTPFELAQRFVGEIVEREDGDHPFIVWCHDLVGLPKQPDEVPWCSSFVNAICWLLRLPRSKSARARSWLNIGTVVPLSEAVSGYDVAVLKRGASPTAGHVGFFAGLEGKSVRLLGGNQSNAVTFAQFPVGAVIGVRRLRVEG